MSDNTAILIFSRLPEEENLSKKNLQLKGNVMLWQHLYNHSIKAAKKTGLPVLTVGEKEQVGNSFGEKITHAITQGFEKGYENLIVLGTDCPQISTSIINNAYTKLTNGNTIVAGQDMRGGVYLVGLNKNAFNATTFLGFSWQTNRLFTDIALYAAGYTFCKLDAVLKDINTAQDIVDTTHAFTVNAGFKQLLTDFFADSAKLYFCFTAHIQTFHVAINQILRGPPAVA